SAVGATAEFTPTSPLAAGVLYTATITTGVTDQAGNALAAPFTWTFTAGLGPDVTVPTVTTMVPASGALAVPPNQAVSATFSKAMDPSTLNAATFTLTGPGPTSIAGKVTYVATSATSGIATFTPTSALATGQQFTAAVTTGADDLEGNALAVTAWSFTTGSTASLSPLNFGAASGFQIVSQAGISNTGTTTLINGDIGATPVSLTSITGFSASNVNGTIYADSDAPIVAALASVMTAYNSGTPAALPGATDVDENLAGLTLTPGLYTSAATSFEITGGNLTLNALGDANAVWIFQTPSSTLTLTTPLCQVILENGAQFSNIFWVVGSSATVGVGCVLEGNILADTSITVATGGTLQGKAYAGAVAPSGAVTVDTANASSAGGCNQ